MKTSAFPASGYFNSLIDSVTKLDDYSVELKTKESQPRLSTLLGVTVWGNNT